MGTPNELTNQQGEVVWLADYEAWGNTAKVIYNEIKINQLTVSQEHVQPIRFQGQYFDTETGLHYNRFRYYDPDMGMFTSRDPIGLMGGDNVFAYAPNPTGWVDPLGLELRHGGDLLGISEQAAISMSTPRGNGRSKVDLGIVKALTSWHFEGRDARNGVHPTYAQVNARDSRWRLLPKSQSILHDDGVGKPEEKYVHPDGREAVFNGDCLCPEIRPKYKGTYNYINPGEIPEKWYDGSKWIEYGGRQIGHGITDVVPWVPGGNVRGDN